MSDVNVRTEWGKILSPEVLKANLLLASLYLAGYEILTSAITDRIRAFMIRPYLDEDQEGISLYQEVLALHKSPLKASLLWLQEQNAITLGDMEMIDAIREHRNALAHQLPKFLIDANHDIDLHHFENLRYLLRKIETWWIQQVEIPSNPDYDGIQVKDEDIVPGSVMVLDAIIQTALEGIGERKIGT